MNVNKTQFIAPRARTLKEKKEVKKETQATQPVVVIDGWEYPLNKHIISMGRHIQNDIVLANQGSSRFHCRIVRFRDIYILQDLNSTNGTMYKDDLLYKPVRLNSGDAFYIADTQVSVKF